MMDEQEDMVTVMVDRVSIPRMSTIGYAYGRTEDGRYVEVVGDHRMMRNIGEALSEASEPVEAYAPSYAVSTIADPEEKR